MNLKAVLLGAGVPGAINPSFTPFSYQEMKQFVGLYILQGLNPSPRVDMKFSSQNEDPIQGNDLCCHMFQFCDTSNSRPSFQFKIQASQCLNKSITQHTRSIQY